nr:hypothetical protein B0A51_09688 [Rachicladosporium sp. CCFEE 5018]
MRFGRTLEIAVYAPWREQYIDYAKLKKLLREDESAANSPDRQTAEQWTEDDEGDFVAELVNVQLEKVHAFHKETYDQLREQTAKCEQKLDAVAVSPTNGAGGEENEEPADGNGNGSGKKPVPSEEEKSKIMKDVLSELDKITKETSELEKYSRINYSGFLKAAKKHDRKRGHAYRVRPLLQVRLAALPFNKEDYSPLLYRLSAMYNFIRQHLDGAETPGMSISEPHNGKEEYTSHRFWVHPENLLEVKTIILRRLPVLVYNPQTTKIAEANQPNPSITSIYFDNPGFSLYTQKVDHGEATSLRLRWYGQLNAKPEIYVEKKTVREDDSASEERLAMKEKYVQQFIKNDYKMDKQIQKLTDRAGASSPEVKNFKTAVDEIQDFIKSNDLQPVLRANYTRTAFQIPGDDRVRVSLDTDLAFIREDAIDTDRPIRDPDSWHRTDIDSNGMEYPFASIRKGEISKFPFALLEIKIRSADRKRSAWVKDLMSSHLVKEAPRFSKFVHGVALLFEDYVNTFPFWLSEMETDIRQEPQAAFEEEQAKAQKQRDDEFAVGSLLTTKPSKSSLRSGSKAVLSPVGSPNVSTSFQPKSLDTRKSNLAPVAESQAANTAGEPDDDETGTRGPATSKLTTLFPSFSTSKYARSRRTALPPGVSRPETWIKDSGPVKVEAKVWLANQRTFIKWQHVSVLLGTLGLGLYNAAGVDNNVARGLAVVYTLVAVFAGMWGYFVYMWRVSLIKGRSGKDFDAVAGPVIVCLGLGVGLVLNFVFKYRAAIEEREHHHGDLNAVSWNQTAAMPHYGDL